MRLVRYSYPTYRNLTPAAAAVRSPWSGLETEIDRLFETALRDFSDGATAQRVPVDLYEDTENTYVRAQLPGFNRDDINVELAEGFLTLTANRAQSENADSFSFSRSVTVGDQVDPTKVAAAYENGILTVTLPKREEAKPKKITVAVK